MVELQVMTGKGHRETSFSFLYYQRDKTDMICVIAKLVSDAAERLNILRKAVASKEQLVKPFRGHITIAAYLPDDEEFLPVCAEIIRDTSAFRIRYEKLGKGIASHTLDLLIQDAREKGLASVSLEATEAGRPLYEKYGFSGMKDEMELIL